MNHECQETVPSECTTQRKHHTLHHTRHHTLHTHTQPHTTTHKHGTPTQLTARVTRAWVLCIRALHRHSHAAEPSSVCRFKQSTRRSSGWSVALPCTCCSMSLSCTCCTFVCLSLISSVQFAQHPSHILWVGARSGAAVRKFTTT